MKYQAILSLLVAAVLFTGETEALCAVPLYRYWNSGAGDHFYTTNFAEIGAGAHGWASEGIQCKIFDGSQVPGTVPLYRYYQPNNVDHFYTTNPHEIGTTVPGVRGNHGYLSEGIAGYCFEHQVPNTVPLYRYWKASNTDHFYTTNAGEIATVTPGQTGNHGYVSEGVACYVYPN